MKEKKPQPKPFQESIIDAVNQCQNLDTLKSFARLLINTDIEILENDKAKILKAFKLMGSGNKHKWALNSLALQLEERLGLYS